MKSYLKFLSRNKLYTAIEAVGLAVSLAFVILIGSYVVQQYEVAHESPQWKRTFVLGSDQFLGLTYWDKEELEMNIPEVEAATHAALLWQPVIQNGEQPIRAAGIETDADFFQVFPEYYLLEGSLEDFVGKEDILISASLARKMSAEIGQTIKVDKVDRTVKGIYADFDGAFFMPADIIMNITNSWAVEQGKAFNSIGNYTTWYRVREDADHASVRALVDTVVTREFSKMFTDNKPECSMSMPFQDLYFFESGSLLKHGNKTLVYVLIAVGILLFASALFNYINLSVALAGKRAKEMAIRATLGESKGRIRGRYISESILFVTVCLLLAFLLAKALEPVFNRYMAGDVGLEVSLSRLYLGAYALLAVLIGLISGLIPAWMTSRFNPMAIIKGEQRRQTKTVLSRVFIIVQNIITVVLISLALVMELQYHHLVGMPLGANVDGLYYISSGTVGKDVLSEKPYVDKLGTSNGYPGSPQMNLTTTVDGQKVLIGLLQCDEDAFGMFGFGIVKDYGTPIRKSLWFTESAARLFPLDEGNPVPPSILQFVVGDSHIGGIIKDYAVKGPSEVNSNQIGIVSVEEMEGNSTVVLKLNRFDADVRAELKEIGRQESLRFTGHEDYGENNYGPIPELIGKSMDSTRNFISLIELFMLLATLISLLGLVAMSAYYTGMQTRNIAIRKVFGGTVTSETGRSVREYMILVGIAVLIGIPIAIFLSERYLRQFWYRIDHYGWVFVAGALIALAISFLAVLWQSLKAAKTNPAVELKKE